MSTLTNLHKLVFALLLLCCTYAGHAQSYTELTYPAAWTRGLTAVVEANGTSYAVMRDASQSMMLGELIGTTITEITLPSGYIRLKAAPVNVNGKLGVYLEDSTGVVDFGVYDGSTFTVYPSPAPYDSGWNTGVFDLLGSIDSSNFFFAKQSGDRNGIAHYDGNSFTVHPLPAAWKNFSGSATVYNGKVYARVNSWPNEYAIAEIDSSGINVLPNPAGFSSSHRGLQSVLGVHQGKLLISGISTSNQIHLFTYDGTTLTQHDAGSQYHGNYKGVVSAFYEQAGMMYLKYKDNSNDFRVLRFDGTNFTDMGLPADLDPAYTDHLDGKAVFWMFNTSNYKGSMYEFDGSSFSQVANPAGVDKIGKVYRKIGNSVLAQGVTATNYRKLLKYSNGMLSEVVLPTNLTSAPNHGPGINSTAQNGNAMVEIVAGGTSPLITYNGDSLAVYPNPTGFTGFNGIEAYSAYGRTYCKLSSSSSTASAFRLEPPCKAMVTQLAVESDISCANAADGVLTTTAAGTYPPYTYNWSNGETGLSATGLAAGTHTVTVTDTTGCTRIDTLEIANPCPAPIGLYEFDIQDASATLRWDTVCGATAYKIRYVKVGDSTLTVVIKNGNVGQRLITGLTPDEKYRWSVQTKCGTEWGALSRLELFTTSAAPCNIPSGLGVSPLTTNKARLNWTVEANAFQYELRWRIQGGNWNLVAKDGTRDRHWITGLAANTNYEWQIRTMCQAGREHGTRWSALQSFSTASSAKTSEVLLNAHEALKLIAVFPNPAKDQLTVDLGGLTQHATVNLYDLSGRLVQSQRITSQQPTSLQLTGAPAGVYLLSIQAGHLQLHKRIVVE